MAENLYDKTVDKGKSGAVSTQHIPIDGDITDAINTKSTFGDTPQLDENIIRSLSEAYLGIDGFKTDIDLNRRYVPFSHQTYFKAFLKEKSLTNAVSGKKPLKTEYRNFYEDFPIHFVTEKKKGLLNMFSSSKSSLPEEDINFFNNLNRIITYVDGGNVNEIGTVVDQVLTHRDTYKNSLTYITSNNQNAYKTSVFSSTDMEDDSTKLRQLIGQRRRNALTNEFKLYDSLHRGTLTLLPALDTYIDNILELQSELGININKIEPLAKEKLFNTAAEVYIEVFNNPLLPSKREVTDRLNGLHQKIFNIPKEMIVRSVENGKDVYAGQIALYPTNINIIFQ